MSITDIITFFLGFFFLILGASRGLMNSLLVPFSFIITSLISFFYFQITHDLITSLILGLIGPLLLNLLLRYLLKMWAKATNREIKPNILSRLGGSILTFIWGWVFLIFALVLLAVLPLWGNILTAVHNDVKNSASYNFVAKPWAQKFFAVSNQNLAPMTATASNADTKSLAEDPRFQKILKDPEIQKEIEAHDIVNLMKNPKMMDLVQKIMNDPATMKKVLALYSSKNDPTLNLDLTRQ